MADTVQLTCSGCGCGFVRPHYDVVEAEDYYCSHECRKTEYQHSCPWEGCEYGSDSELGIKQHHKRTHGVSLTEIELTCDECGKKFTRQRSKDKYFDGTFCSSECKYNKLSDTLSESRQGESNPMFGKTGEDHPNYRGGYGQNYGEGWQRARRNALKRDNYECQDCGLTRDQHHDEFGYDLEVHHIQPFRTFDDASNANDLTNLITLCTTCHVEREHSTA